MIYGYIRVSTDKQDCENQKIGIEQKAQKLGMKIDKYIKDYGVSGLKEPEERQLGKILKQIKKWRYYYLFRTVKTWTKTFYDYAYFRILYEIWSQNIYC